MTIRGRAVAALFCVACGGTSNLPPPAPAVAPFHATQPAAAPAATAQVADEHRVFELYEAGCASGSGDGCNWLGVAYEDGLHGVRADRDRAIGYFDVACKHRYAWGCVNLGAMLLDADEADRDTARARTVLQQACDQGVPRGCTLAAGAAFDTSDDAAAFDLAHRACDGHDALGCAVLAGLHLQGRGTKKDATRAADLYGRACEAQSAVACMMMGRLSMNGEGVPKDPSQAVAYYRRGCDMGNAIACNDLGIAYVEGTGVTTDDAKGKELLDKACKMHEGTACTNLAHLLEPAAPSSP